MRVIAQVIDTRDGRRTQPFEVDSSDLVQALAGQDGEWLAHGGIIVIMEKPEGGDWQWSSAPFIHCQTLANMTGVQNA